MCSPLVHVCAIGDAARANPYDILKNVETSPSSLVQLLPVFTSVEPHLYSFQCLKIGRSSSSSISGFKPLQSGPNKLETLLNIQIR